MKRTNRIAFSALTSFAIHSIGFIFPTTAETITVNRGPNGAIHQVSTDRIPQDAQVHRETLNTRFPNLITKEPHGVTQIAS